ncbi:hypothetical protein LPJ53_001581 [Coemansia erecta]|uniref:Glycosyl transferase family 25 domain-containing protein n=1 Tax=Coemansia erecta TaxID=147472 RepID=A0A9W8CSP1_9FUNG|nr:hypothetical protein LPJ53_001581 [Coemansia erecta]
MLSLPGTNTAWWYGRAIRLYFLFSLAASALWLVKVVYIDSFAPDALQTKSDSAAQSALPSHHDVTGGIALVLQEPVREYRLAFTDHIYCINKREHLGRKERMRELLSYMHLDVQMFGQRNGHMDVWRDMINSGYERAIVLEDDIDFEIDAVSTIGKALGVMNTTQGWDILYIGHCSMEENQGKAKPGFGRVHKAVHPFCTSGYVLSRQGAQKLYAYFFKNMKHTHSLDVQLVALIKRKLLNAYSVYPPVVYQRRDLYPSDDGVELKIHRLLANSAWNEARMFVLHLENWTDPLDEEFLNPAFKHIPSWMEDRKAVN